MSNVKAAQSEATRGVLIRVGRRLFARRGFDAVSSEELVAAARLTRGALYHHFDGKQGLFRAVVEEAMGDVKARLTKGAAGASSPLEALELGAGAFLAACTDPALQRILLIDGPAVLGWHQWRELDLEYGLGLLRRGLQAAADARQLAVPDIEMATHLIGGALIDGAMLISRNRDDPALVRRVEATVRWLLRGLAAPPDRARS